MRAADTNVLVRLIARDDPRQTGSADRFIESGIWISVITLAETIWVLASFYKHTHAELMDAIEMLLKNELVILHDSDAVESALDLFRTRPALGFSECLTLELARKAGHLPLGTFDRDLAKAVGTQKL